MKTFTIEIQLNTYSLGICYLFRIVWGGRATQGEQRSLRLRSSGNHAYVRDKKR